MSIPETPKASGAMDASNKLRLELKQWENAFAAANGGRKAGREDIKQHPEIADKYKTYNKLRIALVNQTTDIKTNKRPSLKPRNTPLEQTTPKRRKLSQPLHPATLHPYDSPRSAQRTPTPHRTCIGPTPQKDGRVLGLFDLLSPAGKDQNTPSKRTTPGVVPLKNLTTPLKPLSIVNVNRMLKNDTNGMPIKSPMSNSKRAHQNGSLTPTTRHTAEQRTPGSRNGVSKMRFDVTPTFLRRDSQKARTRTQNGESGQVDESEKISWSPVAVRRQPKPLGRGLSALVKGLRALEDEKLDEEMELMRAMEQDEVGDDEILEPNVREPEVTIEDSEVADMPLGPDGFGNSDYGSEDIQSERKGRDGKPLKAWKKKGQKRTTRKSNMKPTTGKWKPEPKWIGPEGQGVEDELVTETQVVGQAASSRPVMGIDDGNDMEYLIEEEHHPGGDAERLAETSKKSKGKDSGKPDEGMDKSAPQKKRISSTAHANFRALKIKNKQPKAKGGGRYGRKRR